MAKYPEWSAQIIPNGSGPLRVQSGNAGAVGQGLATLGRSVADVGIFLTAEAKQAEEKTAALERVRQVSKTVRQQARTLDDFRTGLRQNPDTDSYEPQFEAMQRDILDAVGDLPDDEVRAKVQAEMDERLDLYRRDMLGYRQTVRIRNWESEYEQAVDAAVQTNDASLVAQPLAALKDNNLISESEAASRLAEVNDRVRIWNRALSLGWKEGLRYINDVGTWKGTALEPKEIADLKGKVQGNLGTQRTLEAIEENQRQARLEQANDGVIADAFAGSLDLTELWPRVRSGEVDRQVATQAESILKAPRAESDLGAITEVREAILDYQAGGKTQTEARDVVLAQASKLSKTDGPAMLNRLYGVVEAETAYWQREAEKNIEDSIFPRDYFGQQERKEPFVTVASEVKLRLDKAMETARREGRPLTGRDIVIKARDLAAQARTRLQVDLEKNELAPGLHSRKVLDLSTAVEYLRRADGDRAKAKELAAADGYEAPE